jgi:hypothetical protein
VFKYKGKVFKLLLARYTHPSPGFAIFLFAKHRLLTSYVIVQWDTAGQERFRTISSALYKYVLSPASSPSPSAAGPSQKEHQLAIGSSAHRLNFTTRQ